jgi:hypothetical protein
MREDSRYTSMFSKPEVSPKQAIKFTKQIHLDALNALIKPDDAVQINEWIQLEALKTKSMNINQALLFNKGVQLDALKAGVNADDAIKFTLDSQVEALLFGGDQKITHSQALLFVKDVQQYVLRHDKITDFNDALKFSNYNQLEALNLGLSIEQALMVSNIDQISAFKTGLVTFDQALEYNDFIQREALKTGILSHEQAVQFKYNYQLFALNDAIKHNVQLDQEMVGKILEVTGSGLLAQFEAELNSMDNNVAPQESLGISAHFDSDVIDVAGNIPTQHDSL